MKPCSQSDSPSKVVSSTQVRAAGVVSALGRTGMLVCLLVLGCKAESTGSGAAAPAPEPAGDQAEMASADVTPDADGPGAEGATLAQAAGGASSADPQADVLDDAGPQPAMAEDAGANVDDPPAVDPGPRTVLILGDSLAATGIGALLERQLDAHPQVVCHRKGKSASGLARPDFFDWMAEGKRQVELRDPDLVVVVMGGNDGQDLTRHKRGQKRVPWQHEDWPAEYRARMDAFLSTIGGPDRKVLWLGLPTMGLRSLERKLELIRQIQQQAVVSLGDGGVYLDTAPFVTDESGALLETARVGKSSKLREIRAEDRIHFTMSGSEYLAQRLYPEVLSALELEDVPLVE